MSNLALFTCYYRRKMDEKIMQVVSACELRENSVEGTIVIAI